MRATSVRRWHSYLGLFIAPRVMFFALTGAVQLFGLHEAHGEYKPAVILQKLGALHKDQVLAVSPPREAPPPDGAPSPAEADDKPNASTLALKWSFLFVAVSLVISTALGLWMGFTQMRKKRLAWALVIAGTLPPTILLIV